MAIGYTIQNYNMPVQERIPIEATGWRVIPDQYMDFQNEMRRWKEFEPSGTIEESPESFAEYANTAVYLLSGYFWWRERGVLPDVSLRDKRQQECNAVFNEFSTKRKGWEDISRPDKDSSVLPYLRNLYPKDYLGEPHTKLAQMICTLVKTQIYPNKTLVDGIHKYAKLPMKNLIQIGLQDLNDFGFMSREQRNLLRSVWLGYAHEMAGIALVHKVRNILGKYSDQRTSFPEENETFENYKKIVAEIAALLYPVIIFKNLRRWNTLLLRKSHPEADLSTLLQFAYLSNSRPLREFEGHVLNTEYICMRNGAAELLGRAIRDRDWSTIKEYMQDLKANFSSLFPDWVIREYEEGVEAPTHRFISLSQLIQETNEYPSSFDQPQEMGNLLKLKKEGVIMKLEQENRLRAGLNAAKQLLRMIGSQDGDDYLFHIINTTNHWTYHNYVVNLDDIPQGRHVGLHQLVLLRSKSALEWSINVAISNFLVKLLRENQVTPEIIKKFKTECKSIQEFLDILGQWSINPKFGMSKYALEQKEQLIKLHAMIVNSGSL